MGEATDMTTPVTRGELRAEIQELEVRLEHKLEVLLDQKLDQKLDEKLDRMLDEKLDRILDEKLDRMLDEKLPPKLAHLATRADLEIWGGALLERLSTDLARHVRAMQESVAMQISAVDDKYADLPARVSRLEATLPSPTQR